MGKMTGEQFALYERRIDNCYKAADACSDPQFKEFWYQTAMALIRKVNRSLSSAGTSITITNNGTITWAEPNT
jgi:hypothetical protein